MSRKITFRLLFLVLLVTAWHDRAGSQEQPGHGTKGEVHQLQEWQFALPQGDPGRGREVFMKLECYSCHQVLGEKFPQPGGDVLGPELSQMATQHPSEYFAESIMNPSAVIEDRYRAADGRSKMPSFNDIITVEELIDLAAFLKSLGGAHRPSPGGQKH